MSQPTRLIFGLTVTLVFVLAGASPAPAQSASPAAPPSVAPPPAAAPTPNGAPATAPALASPDAAAKLTGIEAWKTLVGNTVTGIGGSETFSEYFDPAGSVKYVDQNGLSTGTWAVQGERVCFDFPDDDDRSCSTFEVSGPSGSARDDDGATIHFKILPGNSKGL